MRIASACVALTLVVMPARAFGAPAEKEVRATVEVDTSAVGEAGPIIHRRIQERADVVLREAEVLPKSGAEDPTIKVAVTEVTGEDPGFTCELWVEREGRALGERRRVECNLCTETEIVAKAEVEIAAMVAALPEILEKSAKATAPTTEPTHTDARPTPPIEDDGGRRPLGPKGKAGVALLVTGIVGAGVGIGLAIPGWKPVDGDPTRERSTRPVGLGFVGLGGALLVTGAVLLGLDRRKADKRKTTALVVPARGGVQLGITGRF